MKQIVELNPFSLVTVEQAYDHLRHPSPDEKFDVIRAINKAMFRLESFLGRKLLEREYDWRLDGTGGRELYLPEYPVTDVARVSWWDDSNTVSEDLGVDDLLIDDYGLIRLSIDAFPRGRRNIQVLATAGYNEDDYPHEVDELRGYCLELLTITYQSGLNQQGEAETIAVGPVSATFPDKVFPNRIKSALLNAGYRKVI